ncbi:uncharacterized protein LOC135486640 [Lineus longissimus]|uniref:uncharacterized protein LOC135486640 n=1 Tax=Lineus longissimus TaxID=88925 RepID=UPI00315C7641
MASKHRDTPACAICLEAQTVVKVVPTCKHVFCRKCLSKHLRSLGLISQRFPCPTCHVESLLPDDGVDGFLDFTEATDVENKPVSEPGTGTDTATTDRKKTICKMCRFTKKIDIEADHLCEECRNLHLCKDCTILHKNNKATENHILTPLKLMSERGEVDCVIHEHLITSFCFTCSTPVCPVCIQIDHGDHSLEKITAVFRTKINEVKRKTEAKKKRSRDIKFCERELIELTSLALGKMDQVVSAVEEYSNRCIENIIKQKTDMKKAIVADFDIILDVIACLDNIPDLTKEIDESVVKAQRILSDAEPCSSDLVKLYSVSKEMDEADKKAEHIKRDLYLQPYNNIWPNLPHFVPSLQEYNLGKLVPKKAKRDETLELIFEKKLEADNPTMFIPCVANLGKGYYAVALPSKGGADSNAIDIYKFPCKLLQTFKELDNPLHDMASTPDGNLAVLSQGRDRDTCSVQLFHPENGFMRSIESTNDVVYRELLSFAVNLQHEYVILSKVGVVRMVTVLNEDGSIKLSHKITERMFNISSDASRITCSARHIYVMANWGFAAYEVRENQMTLMMTHHSDLLGGVKMIKDISTTYFDLLAICYNITDKKACIKTFDMDYDHSILNVNDQEHGVLPQGADSETRISENSNFIVSSQGCAFRVYQLTETKPSCHKNCKSAGGGRRRRRRRGNRDQNTMPPFQLR